MHLVSVKVSVQYVNIDKRYGMSLECEMNSYWNKVSDTEYLSMDKLWMVYNPNINTYVLYERCCEFDDFTKDGYYDDLSSCLIATESIKAQDPDNNRWTGSICTNEDCTCGRG